MGGMLLEMESCGLHAHSYLGPHSLKVLVCVTLPTVYNTLQKSPGEEPELLGTSPGWYRVDVERTADETRWKKQMKNILISMLC